MYLLADAVADPTGLLAWMDLAERYGLPLVMLFGVAFAGLKILTLDEVIDIAEGGVNKPGLYLETKVPKQFPGIEKDLKAQLQRHGWLAPRTAPAPR